MEVWVVTKGVVGRVVVFNTSVVESGVVTVVSLCDTEMVETACLLIVVIPSSVTSVKGLSDPVKPWSAISVIGGAEVLLRDKSVGGAEALCVWVNTLLISEEVGSEGSVELMDQ